MSGFNNNSITMKGAVAIAALIAGGTLHFTRIAVGDGKLPAGQTPFMRTDLVHRLFDVKIREIYYDSESQATVMGTFSNVDNETEWYYRELGLFAKDPATGAEILFCYANAGDLAELIPAAGGSSLLEKEVRIVTLVGNATNVTATIPSGIYPTREEMNSKLILKADLDATDEEGGRVVARQMRFDASQTLYVDAAASAEGADGSEAKPYKTIQAAIDARYRGTANYVVKIKPGTYAEAVSLEHAAGTSWSLERNGTTGVVSINSLTATACNYLALQYLTFTNGGGADKAVTIGDCAAAVLVETTINAGGKVGIEFGLSKAAIFRAVVNNASTGLNVTNGSTACIIGLSGTGNTVGIMADGSIVTASEETIAATTVHKTGNGGAINAEGGASSFPSNFSHSFYIGDMKDAGTLRTLILSELNKLSSGEAREINFANNIPGGFGAIDSAQMVFCHLIKNGSGGKNNGLAIFYTHQNAAAYYVQIRDGAFATDTPVAFADWRVISDGATSVLDLPTGTYSMKNVAAAQGLPTTQHGTLIVDDNVGSKHLIYFVDEAAKIYSRTRNTSGVWGGWIDYAPTATTTTFGLVKLADDTVVIDDAAADAAITPAVYHDVSDFRHKETAYALGDKVECMFNFELFLECTQAGTTASTPLDTRNVTHGQVLTDGTVQWTVRTHFRSINGLVPDAQGNVELKIDTTPPIATTEEARAGVDDTKMMTPLKTKQAIQEFAAITLKVW